MSDLNAAKNANRNYKEFIGLREAAGGKLRAHFETSAGEEFDVSLLEAERARAIDYNNPALRACSVAIEDNAQASDQLDEEDPKFLQVSEDVDAAIKEKRGLTKLDAA